jgi:hypothetical protein
MESMPKFYACVTQTATHLVGQDCTKLDNRRSEYVPPTGFEPVLPP